MIINYCTNLNGNEKINFEASVSISTNDVIDLTIYGDNYTSEIKLSLSVKQVKNLIYVLQRELKDIEDEKRSMGGC